MALLNLGISFLASLWPHWGKGTGVIGVWVLAWPGVPWVLSNVSQQQQQQSVCAHVYWVRGGAFGAPPEALVLGVLLPFLPS